MFEENDLSWLLSLRFSFIFYDLVILCQLNFVGLDHLGDFRFLGFFKAREHLYEVDCNSKDVLRGGNDLLILFGIIFELLIEIYLSPI
jgi:hypothetical protein